MHYYQFPFWYWVLQNEYYYICIWRIIALNVFVCFLYQLFYVMLLYRHIVTQKKERKNYILYALIDPLPEALILDLWSAGNNISASGNSDSNIRLLNLCLISLGLRKVQVWCWLRLLISALKRKVSSLCTRGLIRKTDNVKSGEVCCFV